MDRRSHGVWLVLVAGILWGTTGTAQALSPIDLPPVVLGTIRLIIGGAGLLGWALARRAFRRGSYWPYPAVVLAAVGVAAYQPLFFSAVLRAGVAVGTVAAIGSAPMFAGLLGYAFLKERPDRFWVGATLLSFVGCTLLLYPGESSDIDPTGVLLALGAGISYAVYATTGKRILQHQSADALGGVVFPLAAFLLIPTLFLHGAGVGETFVALPTLLYLGLLTTTLAYILFARGLRLVPVSTAVTLSLSEPLTAGLLGILLLGEQLSTKALAGLVLLIAGLAILALAPWRS